MKNVTLLLIVILLLLSCFSCDNSEKKYDVTVRVARSGTLVWYFSIWVNDVKKCGATEYGTNHLTAEQSVVFSENNEWGYYYDYNLELKKGDHIDVIASVLDPDYNTFSCWIFVEDEMKAFDSGTSGETLIIACSYDL